MMEKVTRRGKHERMGGVGERERSRCWRMRGGKNKEKKAFMTLLKFTQFYLRLAGHVKLAI